MTVAETIKEITRRHLEESNGLLFGQSVTAVGWVNGTVPNVKNIIELPMTDVAGAGFAVGAALVGVRPIFVLRFQDFFTLNCNQLVHYAAISKELHGQGVPIYIRCIGVDGAGPVHSVMLHNIPMYFPGITVAVPMTPGEYREVWDRYQQDDTPYFVSEHRSSYTNEQEWQDEIDGEEADIIIYAISDARREAMAAVKKLQNIGIRVKLKHIVWLKPFDIEDMRKPLEMSRVGMVVDNGFPVCGAARNVAYELMEKTGRFVKALSSEDHVKCFNVPNQNRTPGCDRIVQEALALISN
ncbi:transketolase C-terminal domain-containing protein [Acutalibacter intestini]|uniref:transketolase C-terminal domain-containing protein n=1 Tax=Acutalibacter intestini TaxID=3093659 RepID=UPI002AC8A242|nr:transketolase C-terminal domain-containing protein [Acutalibacter sp. M00204]